MPFLFNTLKNKEEKVLVLDIGSGSVAGSIVRFSKTKIPQILYVKRVPLKFLDKLSGERFKNEMIKSLNIVLDDLNKNGSYLDSQSRSSIKKAYCSLASPWFVSQTKVVKIKKEKTFTITEQFISDFIKKEEKDFESSNLFKYTSGRKNKAEIIERKLIDIKLNGYKTDNPLGKKAKEIDLSIFFSMSQESVLDSIEEAILKKFHINTVDFHSFSLISFSSIRDMYEAVSNFLFLDITAEVTDISLVKNGNILNTLSFPIGKNHVLRIVSQKLKTTPMEALSSIKLLLANSLNEEKTKKLIKILEIVKKDWSTEFQKALVSISNSSSVPTTVFFTSDDDMASWYSEIIKSEEFIQFSMTDSPFIVSFINCSSLDAYISFRSRAEKDTFIAVESIFFNRLFELGE